MIDGTGFQCDTRRPVASASDINEAIENSVMNYMHDELGWSEGDCRKRAVEEAKRTRQQGILAYLEHQGWDWASQRVLDTGAGQGGLLLELLARGADAYAVEPSREFACLARLRLADAGFSPERVSRAIGERLPFHDDSFDYVITLQVLEHVRRPKLVLEEIYRALKPGGHCYISTENYWSFYEPHYRVPWFPLLPKRIGSLHLRRLGLDPHYLTNHIFYTSYLQMWHLCRQVGFRNVTHHSLAEKIGDPTAIARKHMRIGTRLLRVLPSETARSILYGAKHLTHLVRPGVQMLLTKPI